MIRKIHDIYDVILKIIVLLYGNHFLKYIRITDEIKKILPTEITTLQGKKIQLDFLSIVKNGQIWNIEFQFPKADGKNLKRFFNYNINSEVRYDQTTETLVFNFAPKTSDEKPKQIGETKSFHPKYFYLGDVDFEKELEKINIKVKSNKKLTAHDEITLLLMCLTPKCKNKAETLKKICKVIKKEELFDQNRYELLKIIIKMEIENILLPEEQKTIKEEIKMTPQAEKIVLQAIREVNNKVLIEAEEKGIEKGKKEANKKIAKEFRDKLDLEELSKITGLSIEEIQKL